MSETTTASVRLEKEKKDKLKEILSSLNSSRQEALEEAVDHVISRYEIIAELPPEELSTKVDRILKDLEDLGCIESEIGIEDVPLHLKIVLLSSTLHLSAEAHEHRTKQIQRHLSDKYAKVPQVSSLNLNPLEIQELKDEDLTEPVEIPASEFYKNGENLALPVKIRYIVETVDLLLGDKRKERFLDITQKMHGDRSPVFIEDKEIEIEHQNQDPNKLTVEVKLPFKRSED